MVKGCGVVESWRVLAALRFAKVWNMLSDDEYLH